jgi:hypothetical protein
MDALLGLVIFVILAAVGVIPFFQIFKRTGHSGWWGLLMLVPLNCPHAIRWNDRRFSRQARRVAR